jgi:hypothetical protein
MIIALSAFSPLLHTVHFLNPKTLHSETYKDDWFSRNRKGGFHWQVLVWTRIDSCAARASSRSMVSLILGNSPIIPTLSHQRIFHDAETIYNLTLITSLWYIPIACLSIPPLSTFYVLIAPRKYKHSHVIAFLLASLSVESESFELHFYTTSHGIRWRARKWFLFSIIYFSNCTVRKYIKTCT